MAIVTAKSDVKEKLTELKKKRKEVNEVSVDDQIRLAEILNDTPRLASLGGTQWEVRALRMGTQYLIAGKILEITKAEDSSAGDLLRHFFLSLDAVCEVVAYCLLNDKNRLYKEGNEANGFSELFYATKDTLLWDCDPKEFMPLLVDVFEMLDISFFFDSLNTLDMFRQMITAKKRMRKKMTMTKEIQEPR